MELFKGFIKTSGKKPIEKFRKGDVDESKFHTFDEVKLLKSYAGILADDVILIDVDDFGQSETLLDIVDRLEIRCRVYETDRGKHFLFKNNTKIKNGTHLQSAIGLSIDIKCGNNNSPEVLKLNNKNREIIYDKLKDEEYDYLEEAEEIEVVEE